MNPNFDRLNTVLFLEGEPDRVPFYDLFADPEVIEAIMGEPLLLKSLIGTMYDVKAALRGDQKLLSIIRHDVRVQVKFFF